MTGALTPTPFVARKCRDGIAHRPFRNRHVTRTIGAECMAMRTLFLDDEAVLETPGAEPESVRLGAAPGVGIRALVMGRQRGNAPTENPDLISVIRQHHGDEGPHREGKFEERDRRARA
jgi:hypothetical protein